MVAKNEPKTRGIYVPGSGPLPSHFMWIGERPGKWEAAKKRPFSGLSGLEFDHHYLHLAGLKRDDCYVTNLVKDYLDGNPEPEEWEVERDSEILCDELDRCKPEVVITMGGHSTRHFLPWIKERGWGMEHVEGFAYYYAGVTVFPIYHPASGLHDPDMQYYIARGFKRLKRFLGGEDMSAPVPAQREYIGPKRLNRAALPSTPLDIALDTEFNGRKFWGMSAASKLWSGAAVGEEEWKDFGSRINSKHHFYQFVFHHALVDLPVVEDMGFFIPESAYDDTMLLSYVLQCHPQSLKALGYRLCGLEMREYDDVVRPAQNRIAEKWFAEAVTVCAGGETPSNNGAYHGDQLLESLTSSARESLSARTEEMVFEKGEWRIKRGWSPEMRVNRILIDYHNKSGVQLKKRFENIPAKQQETLQLAVGRSFPVASLADIPEPEAVEYASGDAYATYSVLPILKKQVEESGLSQVYEMDLACYPIIRAMREGGMRVDREYFHKLHDRAEEELEEINDKIADCSCRINPASGDQVAALLFNTLKIIPKGKVRYVKSGTRPSTQDKYLESWRSLHPVIGLICDYREVLKIKGTYIEAILEKSEEDGYLYPDLQTTRQYTGRFSGKEPNVLAMPARGEWGKRIRAGFITQRGHVWGCWDLNAIELRWLAFVSKDEFLLDIFHTKKDPHTQMASKVFGVPYGKVDSDQRKAAKQLNYGTVYGIQAQGLLDQLQRLQIFRFSLADCGDMIHDWFQECKGVQNYFYRVDAFVRRNGFVQDYWGRIRRMEQIHSAVDYIREEAIRQARNHTIQGGATGVLKRWLRLVWLWGKPWCDPIQMGDVRPLLPVHDELDMSLRKTLWEHVNESVIEAAADAAPDEMRKMGLEVIADGGEGDNWAEAKGK